MTEIIVERATLTLGFIYQTKLEEFHKTLLQNSSQDSFYQNTFLMRAYILDLNVSLFGFYHLTLRIEKENCLVCFSVFLHKAPNPSLSLTQLTLVTQLK